MKALQKELNKYRFENEDLNIKASIKDEDYYDFTPEHFDGFKLSHIKEFDDDFKENIKPKEVVEANINVLEDTGVDHFKLEGFNEDPFQFFTGLKIEPIKSHYLDGYYEHKLQGKTNKDIIEMRLLREGDAEINGYKGRDEDFEDFKLQYPELFGDPDLDISFESADSYSYGLDDLTTPKVRRASTSKTGSTEDINEFFERPEIDHSRKSDKASASIPVEKATFQPKLARSLASTRNERSKPFRRV